jgi:hypothetical protein
LDLSLHKLRNESPLWGTNEMQVDSNEMKSLLILRILFENEGKSFESRFISIQIRAYPDDIHDLAFPDLVTRKWTIKRVPLNCLYTISAEIYIYGM